MKRSVIALCCFIALMPGCSSIKEGVDWVFFPNETAVRKQWEEERTKLDEQRTKLVTEMEIAAKAQRDAVKGIVDERIELQRKFQVETVNFNADLAKLENKEQTAVREAKQLLDSIQAKLENLGDLYADLEEAFETKLKAASSQDMLLWSILTGLVGLTGGGGLVAARTASTIRNKVAEARDEQGEISREEAFGLVWNSIDAIKDAYPSFEQFWNDHPEYGDLATKILKAGGDQYLLLAEKKKAERKNGGQA